MSSTMSTMSTMSSTMSTMSEQVSMWASDNVSKFIKNITYIATIFNILNWKEVLMKINSLMSIEL